MLYEHILFAKDRKDKIKEQTEGQRSHMQNRGEHIKQTKVKHENIHTVTTVADNWHKCQPHQLHNS